MGSAILASVPAGDYVSGIKVIPVVLILLAWVRALSWVDKDAEAARLNRDGINSALLGGLIVAFALFLLVPNFFIAFIVLLAVIGVEAGIYLSMRKKAVGLSDLKTDFKAWVKSMGREKKEVEEIAGAVQIVGANGSLLPAPRPQTPEAESYNGIQKLLTDPPD